MSRSVAPRRVGIAVLLGALLLSGVGGRGLAGPAAPDLAPGLRMEVVATQLPRPIQLALGADGRLVVLSQGWQGSAAGELYHLDLGRLPVDAARAPRLVLPFSEESRKTAFGSLAVGARGDVFVGEENGNRVYVWSARRLRPAVLGLNHLVGGGSITLDRQGRLIVVDHASPESHLRSESPLPPSLAWLTDEGYRGPLIFRLDVGEGADLPRRVDLQTPLFPRRWSIVPGQELPWRFVAAVGGLEDDILLLNAVGEVLRLDGGGALRRIARLPGGHYHRTNLAVGPDGSVYVSAGFHIRHVYRVTPGGQVSWVARDLGDPGGLAVDAAGALYIAETALHRVIRIVPTDR